LGAPVITSDATSLKEVAGQAAILIKNNSDVEEIYQAMKSLAENENLRQELIQKGKKQASRFSWQECAEKTLEKLLIPNRPNF
jgi:glycosyltransferase involved in cell wall biosynthesis